MRRLALLFSVAFLVISPAQAGNDSLKGSAIFGSRPCRPTFQCPSASNRERQGDMTQIAANAANTCLSKYYSINKPGGVIETVMGLDANQCLYTKKMDPDASGLALTPKCCITPVENTGGKTCQVSCVIYGVKK